MVIFIPKQTFQRDLACFLGLFIWKVGVWRRLSVPLRSIVFVFLRVPCSDILKISDHPADNRPPRISRMVWLWHHPAVILDVFADHLAVISKVFADHPAVLLDVLQTTPTMISETFSDHPAAFLAHQTPPTNLSNEIALRTIHRKHSPLGSTGQVNLKARYSSISFYSIYCNLTKWHVSFMSRWSDSDKKNPGLGKNRVNRISGNPPFFIFGQMLRLYKSMKIQKIPKFLTKNRSVVK